MFDDGLPRCDPPINPHAQERHEPSVPQIVGPPAKKTRSRALPDEVKTRSKAERERVNALKREATAQCKAEEAAARAKAGGETSKSSGPRAVIGTNLETGVTIEFSCIADARIKEFTPTIISMCCNGKRKSHKGYSWRYANKGNEVKS